MLFKADEVFVKIQITNHIKGLLIAFLALTISSCGQKSDVDQSKGQVVIDLPLQSSGGSYSFKAISLFGIENLKEVSGQFVRFYYAPGTETSTVYGDAPQARFIKTGNKFVPMDAISNQMAVIYYHMQNMAQLDKIVGAGNINQWPRIIGIETILANVPRIYSRNNAFYDGGTDSIMFMPYTEEELPIAVNGGVIAHEHFHSLFFKIVLKPALSSSLFGLLDTTKMSLSDLIDEDFQTKMTNRTILMGLNEGLADFWAWVYTQDADFMKWSFSFNQDLTKERSLDLNTLAVGQYKSSQEVRAEVNRRFFAARSSLTDYYYTVGTPIARYLKQLTQLIADEQNRPVSEVKLQVAGEVIVYMRQLAVELSKLKLKDLIHLESIFQHFADNSEALNLQTKSCDFTLKYINYQKTKNLKTSCKNTKNGMN